MKYYPGNMKHSCFFLLIVWFTPGCNVQDNATPCESLSAPIPCEWAIEETAYMNMPRPADSYNFTICPGTEEWVVRTPAEAYQIPDCVLKKMSTQAVIQAVLEWPHNLSHALYNVTYGDEYSFETDAWILGLNSRTELLKRKDAGKALLERLSLMEPVTFYQSQWLEWLFGHSVFLSRLNNNQKRQTVEICLKNDDLRLRDTIYSNIFRSTTFVLIGRTMLADNYAPIMRGMKNDEELRFFIDGSKIKDGRKIYYSYFINDSLIQWIIELAKNYINQQ